MVYSCILFLYEEELVKIRMQEESGYVDKFQIAEGDVTFSGYPKPSGFELPATLSRHPQVLHRVVSIRSVVQDPKRDQSIAWARERVLRSLAPETLEPKDILIVSDCDEIHCQHDMGKVIDAARHWGFVKIPCRNHYYKVNLVNQNPVTMDAPFAATGQYLRETGKTLQELRLDFAPKVPRVQGVVSHHFDYLASPDVISKKLKSFAHQEYSGEYWTNTQRIAHCIAQGLDLFERQPGRVWFREDLTSQYPDSIVKSQESFPDWFA